MDNSRYLDRGCRCIDEKADDMTHHCNQMGCSKLHAYDWLNNTPATSQITDLVEVRFKNTRKGYYKNVNNLNLKPDDIVAVEASPGHDIGLVSLVGELVMEQVRKNRIDLNANGAEIKKVYRKAKPVDIEKWKEAIELEHSTMLRARVISEDLKLNMKIGDVEYQGDKTKAIFYYIADDRVDFRELIKIMAEDFRIRIEMKQIGARQEAGRIGGIGPCGRELCCATWMSNFVSVSTNSARHQEVSLNPQKLAGQCSKLKCCLNYELDSYLDARKYFPDPSIPLESEEGTAYHQKTDVFKKIMWYSLGGGGANNNFVAIPVERVTEIIDLNKKGKKIKKLAENQERPVTTVSIDYQNEVGKESLTRFDHKKKKKKKRKRSKERNTEIR